MSLITDCSFDAVP